ncbi:MAG: UMP kinase [Alphaproteobacteria bacterium]|nr:UMP kinase [Alphaproteobacteria bacterium]
MTPVFKRILLKLSGEGLAGEEKTGISPEAVQKLVREIIRVHDLGVQIGLVVGGGNFFRGAKNAIGNMDRSVADQIGMMATLMNALTLQSSLEECGTKVKIFSGLAMPQVCDTYSFRKAIKALQDGKIVLFAAGTGSPYFSTDSGAALRAAEMHCDVLMKATQVDGVYDSDPRTNPNAQRYDEVSYDEVVAKQLKVMDLTAVSMARDNHIPIMVFEQKGEDSIVKAVCGQVKHTMIKQRG